MAEWVALGDRAIRFVRPRATSPRAIVQAVREWPNVIDVVVARDDVAVYFADAVHVDDAKLDALAGLRERESDEPVREIELHAIYDGPDLEDVARACGVSIEQLVTIHAAQTYVVETMGFAPGFAYLSGLEARLAGIPRRSTPRPRVPASSLAIAGGYTAVYPFDSPGGWHLLGRVEERMFGMEGARLRFGDRVRFIR
jgi:KipI family sensor histidine kinase inhibitor